MAAVNSVTLAWGWRCEGDSVVVVVAAVVVVVMALRLFPPGSRTSMHLLLLLRPPGSSCGGWGVFRVQRSRCWHRAGMRGVAEGNQRTKDVRWKRKEETALSKRMRPHWGGYL